MTTTFLPRTNQQPKIRIVLRMYLGRKMNNVALELPICVIPSPPSLPDAEPRRKLEQSQLVKLTKDDETSEQMMERIRNSRLMKKKQVEWNESATARLLQMMDDAQRKAFYSEVPPPLYEQVERPQQKPETSGRGGARQGSGRPVGSKNRVISEHSATKALERMVKAKEKKHAVSNVAEQLANTSLNAEPMATD